MSSVYKKSSSDDLFGTASFGGGGGGGGGRTYTSTNTPLVCAVAGTTFAIASNVPNPLVKVIAYAGVAATAYACSGGGMNDKNS